MICAKGSVVVLIAALLVGCVSNNVRVNQNDWVDLRESSLPRYVKSIGYGDAEISASNELRFVNSEIEHWSIRFGDKIPLVEYSCGDKIHNASCMTVKNLVCIGGSLRMMNCRMGLLYFPGGNPSRVCDIYSWEKGKGIARSIRCPDEIKLFENNPKTKSMPN